MKKFNNFKDAFEWAGKVLNDGIEKATEVVAEQVYKDSDEFTYRQSGEMYQSGEAHSNFKEGIIIERTPYVRRRYYEGGVPGGKDTVKIKNKKPTYNPKAQPRWFDKTVAKHKSEYQEQIRTAINQAKKGG